MTIVLAALAAACVAAVPSASFDQGQGREPQRILEKEVVVDAAVEDVWNAWSTEEGLRFISNRSRVELRVGGPYEWFLDGPVESDGRRGAEGSRVLAFLPQEMIAFEWTFPPSLPALRKAGATTQVVVLLDELEPRRTRVRLNVLGWQEGADWDEGYEYFDAAWSYVLTALKEKLGAAPAGQAEGPRVAEGDWIVRTTIRRGEQVVLQDSSTRTRAISCPRARALQSLPCGKGQPMIGWINDRHASRDAARGDV